MPSPADDEALRLLAQKAHADDRVELDLQELRDRGIAIRYATDPVFQRRVDAVSRGMVNIAAGEDPTLAVMPMPLMMESIRGYVAAALAMDDYFADVTERDGKGPTPP